MIVLITISEGQFARFLRLGDRLIDGIHVVAVLDFERLPAVSAEARGDVLGEGHVG